MSHHDSHGRGPIDHIKRKGVIFLAVLVLSVALFLGFTSESDFITASAVFPGGQSESSFNINANLQMSAIDLEVNDITLDITVQSGGLTINGLNIESGSQIVLTNFEGEISINDTVSLDGAAETAVVDNVVLSGTSQEPRPPNQTESALPLSSFDDDQHANDRF